MKKTMLGIVGVLCVFCWTVTGCGGGGTGSTQGTLTPEESGTQTNPTDDTTPVADEGANTSELPPIIDVYTDSLFKYADQSFYEGDYDFVTDSNNSCSNLLGGAMPQLIPIKSVAPGSATITFDDSDLEFTGASAADVGSYDMWGYTGKLRGKVCAIAFASKNTSTGTVDLAGIGCEKDDMTTGCLAAYTQKSAYDFQNTTIKASGDDDVSIMIEAVQLLLQSSH